MQHSFSHFTSNFPYNFRIFIFTFYTLPNSHFRILHQPQLSVHPLESFTTMSYRSKIDQTHLFQQKKNYGIVIIYFKCGLFVKVVEKSRLQNFIRIFAN